MNNCSICLEDIKDDKNKSLTECGHCFHTTCLMSSVHYGTNNCPYCRTNILDNKNNTSQIMIEVTPQIEEKLHKYGYYLIEGDKISKKIYDDILEKELAIANRTKIIPEKFKNPKSPEMIKKAKLFGYK